MAVFSYKANGPQGTETSGVLTADTPRQARDLLRARGLSVQEVAARRAALTDGSLASSFRRRHTAKVVSFIRELSTLLAVGIPLLEAIDTIAAQHVGGFRTSLLALRDRVSGGGSLAEAMREQPALFDEMSVNITDVGEQAGTLESVLDQLAQFKERTLTLKSRVATALIYPSVVLVMAVGVSLLLMTVVVPNLLSALVDTGRPLPFATRVVKGASDFLVQWWWLVLAAAAVGAAALAALLRSGRGKMCWHRFQLRIPIVGDLVRKQSIVRIAIVISTLLKSGVPFVRAVQIAQRSTRNLVIRQALVRCEQAVTSGRDIGDALADTHAFPGMVVQIFAVGQQSGRLEEMLDRLAADYDRQLVTAAQRLTAILEPLFILLMVVLVGFIAFATILPMLEAADV